MLQHFPHSAEVFWLCADQSLPGLRQMREDHKWRAAIAGQQACFFAVGVGMNTAASLTYHINYIKDCQILSVEALADIVWCFASGVRHVAKNA